MHSPLSATHTHSIFILFGESHCAASTTTTIIDLYTAYTKNNEIKKKVKIKRRKNKKNKIKATAAASRRSKKRRKKNIK